MKTIREKGASLVFFNNGVYFLTKRGLGVKFKKRVVVPEIINKGEPFEKKVYRKTVTEISSGTTNRWQALAEFKKVS